MTTKAECLANAAELEAQADADLPSLIRVGLILGNMEKQLKGYHEKREDAQMWRDLAAMHYQTHMATIRRWATKLEVAA